MKQICQRASALLMSLVLLVGILPAMSIEAEAADASTVERACCFSGLTIDKNTPEYRDSMYIVMMEQVLTGNLTTPLGIPAPEADIPTQTIIKQYDVHWGGGKVTPDPVTCPYCGSARWESGGWSRHVNEPATNSVDIETIKVAGSGDALTLYANDSAGGVASQVKTYIKDIDTGTTFEGRQVLPIKQIRSVTTTRDLELPFHVAYFPTAEEIAQNPRYRSRLAIRHGWYGSIWRSSNYGYIQQGGNGLNIYNRANVEEVYTADGTRQIMAAATSADKVGLYRWLQPLSGPQGITIKPIPYYMYTDLVTNSATGTLKSTRYRCEHTYYQRHPDAKATSNDPIAVHVDLVKDEATGNYIEKPEASWKNYTVADSGKYVNVFNRVLLPANLAMPHYSCRDCRAVFPYSEQILYTRFDQSELKTNGYCYPDGYNTEDFDALAVYWWMTAYPVNYFTYPEDVSAKVTGITFRDCVIKAMPDLFSGNTSIPITFERCTFDLSNAADFKLKMNEKPCTFIDCHFKVARGELALVGRPNATYQNAGFNNCAFTTSGNGGHIIVNAVGPTGTATILNTKTSINVPGVDGKTTAVDVKISAGANSSTGSRITVMGNCGGIVSARAKGSISPTQNSGAHATINFNTVTGTLGLTADTGGIINIARAGTSSASQVTPTILCSGRLSQVNIGQDSTNTNHTTHSRNITNGARSYLGVGSLTTVDYTVGRPGGIHIVNATLESVKFSENFTTLTPPAPSDVAQSIVVCNSTVNNCNGQLDGVQFNNCDGNFDPTSIGGRYDPLGSGVILSSAYFTEYQTTSSNALSNLAGVLARGISPDLDKRSGVSATTEITIPNVDQKYPNTEGAGLKFASSAGKVKLAPQVNKAVLVTGRVAGLDSIAGKSGWFESPLNETHQYGATEISGGNGVGVVRQVAGAVRANSSKIRGGTILASGAFTSIGNTAASALTALYPFKTTFGVKASSVSFSGDTYTPRTIASAVGTAEDGWSFKANDSTFSNGLSGRGPKVTLGNVTASVPNNRAPDDNIAYLNTRSEFTFGNQGYNTFIATTTQAQTLAEDGKTLLNDKPTMKISGSTIANAELQSNGPMLTTSSTLQGTNKLTFNNGGEFLETTIKGVTEINANAGQVDFNKSRFTGTGSQAVTFKGAADVRILNGMSNGVNITTGDANVLIDGGNYAGGTALTGTNVTVRRGVFTDNSTTTSQFNLDPESKSNSVTAGNKTITTVELANPPIIIDWEESDIDISAPTVEVMRFKPKDPDAWEALTNTREPVKQVRLLIKVTDPEGHDDPNPISINGQDYVAMSKDLGGFELIVNENQTIVVTARDARGNTRDTTIVIDNIDAFAPEILGFKQSTNDWVKGNPDATVTADSSNSVKVYVEATDDVKLADAPYKFLWKPYVVDANDSNSGHFGDLNESDWLATRYFTARQNGMLTVQVKDAVGNITTSDEYYVKNIDSIAPTGRAKLDTENGVTVNPSIGVTVTVSIENTVDPMTDDASPLPTAAVKWASNEPWSTEMTRTFTSNTTAPLDIKVRDSVGNIGTVKSVGSDGQLTDGVVIGNISTSKPKVSLTADNIGKAFVKSPVKLTATAEAGDQGAALEDQCYSWDGGRSWTSVNTFKAYYTGEYEVRVRDKAGNQTRATYTIDNIDDVAPAAAMVLFKAPPTNWDYTLGDPDPEDYVWKMRCEFSDNTAVARVETLWNNGTYTADAGNLPSSGIVFEVTEAGVYGVVVEDKAGNRTYAEKTVTWENIGESAGGRGDSSTYVTVGVPDTGSAGVPFGDGTSIGDVVWSKTGAYNRTKKVFKTYPSGQEGIHADLIAIVKRNTYIKGSATFDGAQYPVTFNGVEGPVRANERNMACSVFVPLSGMNKDIQNGRLVVVFQEYEDSACTKLLREGSATLYVNTQISDPNIQYTYNRSTDEMIIAANSTVAGIADGQPQYSLDGGSWQSYSGPFTVGSATTVHLRATDNCQNTTTLDLPKATLAVSGGGGGNLPTDGVDGSIGADGGALSSYYISGRSSESYILGGTRSNTTQMPSSEVFSSLTG